MWGKRAARTETVFFLHVKNKIECTETEINNSMSQELKRP